MEQEAYDMNIKLGPNEHGASYSSESDTNAKWLDTGKVKKE
jgi:hypothetical protein